MRKFILLSSIAILGACTTPQPIPPEVRAAVDKMPVEELPVYASIEQQRCPKSRYPSFNKRRECKYEIRRENAAREMMREQANQVSPQKAEKEST